MARRRWLSEETLGELIALTQLLPGPSSSQTCFLIGMARGGIAGGFAAWFGFTAPSAMLMIAFAAGVRYARGPLFAGAMHGLQLAAIAVVAAAVWSMFRVLCPDGTRAVMAVAAAAFALWVGGPVAQIAVIAGGAIAGRLLLRLRWTGSVPDTPLPVSRGAAVVAGSVFASIFVALEFCVRLFGIAAARLPLAFYRTGALVFGGGHVVLPLLDQAVVRPGWVIASDFFAGYGAAQAIPGPLFTFAAYLGFVAKVPPNGLTGALISLAAIFLPGLLLAVAVAPFWSRLRALPGSRSALGGVNAAVVGLLISALVMAEQGAIHAPLDVALAVAALGLLVGTRLYPVVIVLAVAGISALLAVLV